MKVSISWLKELVDLNCSIDELVNLLPLRSVSTKEVTEDFIELDMKGYNRADLLSMRGVALEVAVITGSKTLFEEAEKAEFVWNQNELPQTQVKVEDPKLCPFYSVTKIDGLKVEKSSPEVVKKLSDCGLRSVDNITDITNLVMLEYGQPMHAFDTKGVKDETIIIRTANEGERITTLDGKTKDLKTSDLLIADSQNALGIAGVMGGKDSEVNQSTTTILLEAAIFDPINVRKTATSLGLQSEASKRFQHGLTKIRLFQALNAAIKMYESLGGQATTQTFVGDFEDKVRKITLTQGKLEDLVGVKFENKEVERYLKRTGVRTFHIEGGNGWEVEVPYWRLDIELEEDLIEEVARLYGYEKIPAAKVSESKPFQKEDPIFQKISDLRNKLVNLSLTEVQTYSFVTTEVQDALGINDSNRGVLVKLENPMSAETKYLRQSVWPNLLEVVGKNLRQGFKDIAVFEIGKAFNNVDGNPKEDYRLAIALCNGSDNPLQELYQIANYLKSYLEGARTFHLRGGKPPEVVAHLFHPNRFVAFEKDNKQIGGLSEVHLRVLDKLGIEKRVAVLEIEIN